jgi:hypothetical protein
MTMPFPRFLIGAALLASGAGQAQQEVSPAADTPR